MAAAMKRAHELTGGHPSLIRKNDAWTFGNPSVLFMYHSVPGRLDEELSDMKEGCGYYFALTNGHGLGGDDLMKAEAALRRAESASQNSVAIGAARGFRSVTSEIYCHILSACARVLTGERDAAAASLDSALSLALPDRLIMPFAEHYQDISRLLAESTRLARHGSCLKEIKEIEALAVRLEDGCSAYWRASRPHTPFGLTEREYKIACLAAKRLHNREIGEKLFLSEKTIKNCMSVIYGKIGRRGRSHLAALLNETGLDWQSLT
jgi:DNA-binding CsgD family transcriptional regulator